MRFVKKLFFEVIPTSHSTRTHNFRHILKCSRKIPWTKNYVTTSIYLSISCHAKGNHFTYIWKPLKMIVPNYSYISIFSIHTHHMHVWGLSAGNKAKLYRLLGVEFRINFMMSRETLFFQLFTTWWGFCNPHTESYFISWNRIEKVII